MITPCIAVFGIHALLDDAPSPARNKEKTVMVQLVTILNRGAVHFGDEFAGPHEIVRGIAALITGTADVVGSFAAGFALAAANEQVEIAAKFPGGFLKRTAYGRGDAAGM